MIEFVLHAVYNNYYVCVAIVTIIIIIASDIPCLCGVCALLCSCSDENGESVLHLPQSFAK